MSLYIYIYIAINNILPAHCSVRESVIDDCILLQDLKFKDDPSTADIYDVSLACIRILHITHTYIYICIFI